MKNLTKMSIEERQDLARNSRTSLNDLEILAKDVDYFVRFEVSKNPNVSIDILKVLATDNGRYIRENVAKHLNITVELLEELSNDKEYIVRKAVASNIKTPLKILEKLSKDDIDVKVEVAMNVNTSDKILRQFSRHKILKKFVAQNPNIPIDILEELSNDSNFYVKEALTCNINTPIHILEKLFKDDDFYEENVKVNILRHPNMTQEVLDDLAMYNINFIKNPYNDLNTILRKYSLEEVEILKLTDSIIDRFSEYEVSKCFNLDEIKQYPEIVLNCLEPINFNEEPLNDSKNLEK